MSILYKQCISETTLLSSMAMEKRNRNISYLLSLKNDNLLLPFRFEACLIGQQQKNTNIHWGWDSPLSHIRGTFTGHFLSAAAQIYATTGHKELKVKADYIVEVIKECQDENGGEWAFPIPEKYLYRIKSGKHVWAPQYVCHKVMMGLLDMFIYTKNNVAWEILEGCTKWFLNFTKDIDHAKMKEMMDLEETGGMMEFWADIYKISKDERHLTIMKKYESTRLADPLLKGIDALTNQHANSTVPEIHGSASAYEATGEEHYRKTVEAYWDWAVDKRGAFATGGETSGEVWGPPNSQSARLGNMNQEHCVVYNMMRLSQYLFKWTGDKKYSDYWEKNLYNGIFAQGYYQDIPTQATNEDLPLKKGHVAYYLPLESGAQIEWGSETDHFWCCHCTLVQANANFHQFIYYTHQNEFLVTQYLPSEYKSEDLTLKQDTFTQTDGSFQSKRSSLSVYNRPKNNMVYFEITSKGVKKIKFRVPDWTDGAPSASLDGKPVDFTIENGYLIIEREWTEDKLYLTFPKKLTAYPLLDRKDTVAFIDGPVLLVGLIDYQPCLVGDITNPESILVPENERKWTEFLPYYRTVDQVRNIKFVPIYEVGYERYTTYFQVKSK